MYIWVHLFMVMCLSACSIPQAGPIMAVDDLPFVWQIPHVLLVSISLFSTPLVPFVTLWILYLARKGGPSFVAFGLLDAALSAAQWFAVHILYT